MSTESTSSERPLLVITGGAQGIGEAIVDMALEDGYRVAVGDVNEDALEKLCSQRPEQPLEAKVVDISDEKQVEEWIDQLVAEWGPPSALVNNAGIARSAPLAELSLGDWESVLAVNLTGAFLMTKKVGKEMIAAGRGSIVSVASVTSLAPSVSGAYPPSKAALAMLTSMAALEWGRHGVRANTVSPGHTETPMLAPFAADESYVRAKLQRSPLGRLGRPMEVAEAVMFLCSDRARFITGANLAVDGGLLTAALVDPPTD